MSSVKLKYFNFFLSGNKSVMEMDGRGRASALEEGYQMVPFSLKVHTKFGFARIARKNR